MSANHPSLEAFKAWLASAPPTTTLQASDVLRTLSTFTASSTPAQSTSEAPAPQSWRERLWVVPADTRLGVTEAVEAFGRPRSWLYRHTSERATSASAADRIPHRKFDGELVFVAGELRTYIAQHEETIVAGRITPPALSLSARRAS